MSFVRTPLGAIMHVDNHRAAVENARACGLRGMLVSLEPAEPVNVADSFFGVDRTAEAAPLQQWDEAQNYDADELRRLVNKIAQQGRQPSFAPVRRSFFDAHRRAAQAAMLAEAFGWYR